MILTRTGIISLMVTISSVVSAAYNRDLVSSYPENVLPITIPGRYIVEYSSDYDAETSAEEISSSLGTAVSVSQNLDSAYYNGASIQVEGYSNETSNKILSLDFVNAVYPVEVVSLGDWGTYVSNQTSNWNPHSVTGVDKLHDEGVTGEGITVAVIDSGVNYKLEALGGGYGAGYKIIGGYDYVGDNYDYSDPDSMVPDDNPMDCLGHGSFVSSVILGESKDITGVAPKTKIKMYRIFGCSDGTTTDVIMKALSDAATAKPDVINLSLGSASGYSTSPLAKLSDAISENNIPVVWAAGNGGTTGTFYASNGGSSTKSISVGSVDATQGIRFPLTISASNGSTLNTYYYTKNRIQSSFTGTLPADFSSIDGCQASLSGNASRALIIRRGICYVNNEYSELQDSGYEYIFRYNSYDQEIDDWYDVDGSLSLCALISEEAGLWVKAIENSGFNVSITLDASDAADAYDSDLVGAGQVSYYSTMGPTFENDFYPTISAPGGNVLGVYLDTWEVASGTSFSAPYIAGVVALYKQVYGDASTTEIKQRLVATAKLLDLYSSDADAVDTDNLHPLIQQGAGLVNAYKMIHQNSTLLSNYHLQLNDTANRVSEFELEIYNGNSYEVSYNISHVAAATIQGRDSSWYPTTYFPAYDSSEAGVTFSAETLILGAGESGSVKVSFTSPSTSLEGPIFNGRIEFRGDNGETVGVPYMGVDVDTNEWTALEDTPLFLYYNESDAYYYGFGDIPGEVDITSYTLYVYYALRYGTEIFSIDLVTADYDLETDFAYPESSKKFLGSIMSASALSGDTAFPITYPARFSDVGYSYISSFNDSSPIPSGNYKVLVRTLKTFGDRYSIHGWQRYLSSAINITNPDYDAELSSILSSSTSSANSEISYISSQLSTSSELSYTSSFLATPSFVSSSSISSSEISSPASTSGSPTSSDPTVSTSASAAVGTPSGLDDITELKLYDYAHYYQSTLTNVVDSVDDWVVVYVKFYQAKKTYEGSVIQFTIPDDFTDVASGGELEAPGLLAATVSFDSATRLVSIKYDDYIRWRSDVTGSFGLIMRLGSSGKAKITTPGTYTYEFETVSGVLTSDLVVQGVSDSAPTIFGHMNGETGPTWEIYVPAELGDWDSVTVSGAYDSNRWSISCGDSTLVIATAFDVFNEATATIDPDSSDVVKTCSLESLTYEYVGYFTDSTLTKRDTISKALVYTVVGIESVSWATTFEGAFTVDVVSENGTTTYSLNKRVITSPFMIADDYAVSGTRDTPEYTGEPASSTISRQSSSSSLGSYSSFVVSSLSFTSLGKEYSSFVSSSVAPSSASASLLASHLISSALSSSEFPVVSSAPSPSVQSFSSDSSSFSSVMSTGFYYVNSSTVSSVISTGLLSSFESSALIGSASSAQHISVASSAFRSESSSVSSWATASSAAGIVDSSSGSSAVPSSLDSAVIASSEPAVLTSASLAISDSLSVSVFSHAFSIPASTGSSTTTSFSGHSSDYSSFGASSTIVESVYPSVTSSVPTSGVSSAFKSEPISAPSDVIASASSSLAPASPSGPGLSFEGFHNQGKMGYRLRVPGTFGPFRATNGKHDLQFSPDDLYVDLNDEACPSSYFSADITSDALNLKFSQRVGDSDEIEAGFFSSGSNIPGRYAAVIYVAAGQGSLVKRAEETYTLTATLTVTASSPSSSSIQSVTAVSSGSASGETKITVPVTSTHSADVLSSGKPIQSSGASSSPTATITSAFSSSTVTEFQESTVLYTITSCSGNRCSEVTTSGVVSIVTSTAVGSLVTFTTTVPCDNTVSTVTYVATSCSANTCSDLTTSGVISMSTSTAANGQVVTLTSTVPCENKSSAGDSPSTSGSGGSSTTSTNRFFSGVSTASYAEVSPVNTVLATSVELSGSGSGSGSGSSNSGTRSTSERTSTTVVVSGSVSGSSHTSTGTTIERSSTSATGSSDSSTAVISTYEGSASAVVSTCGYLVALIAGALFI